MRKRLSAECFLVAWAVTCSGWAQLPAEPSAAAAMAQGQSGGREGSGEASLPQPRRLTPPEAWGVPSLHALGVMSVMRVGEAVIWPEPFLDLRRSELGRRYADTLSEPPKWDGSESVMEWDGDPWVVNGIGHALFGSELFMRARSCDHGVVSAALLTAAGSTLWEYGFEGNGVRPSGLDLWYTPLAGLLLGEARHWAWRAASRIDSAGWRIALTALIDPLGELERATGTPC